MNVSVRQDSQVFYDTAELLRCAARHPHSGPAIVKMEPLDQPYSAFWKAKELEVLILKQETWS